MSAQDNLNPQQFGTRVSATGSASWHQQGKVKHALHKLAGPTTKATPAELAEMHHMFGDDTL